MRMAITTWTFVIFKQIAEAVERARDNAKRITDTLGMAEILKKSNCWENPPIPVLDNEEQLTDEDYFDEVLAVNDAVPQLLQESIFAEESEDIVSAHQCRNNWKRPVQLPYSIKKIVF